MSTDSFRILLAEDDPHIREVIEYAARNEGFEISSTARGMEALSLCSSENPPSLLVLDVGLPDLDGFEVCRRLRRTQDLPILFLTSRHEEIDRVVGLEIGGDDYMVKPFSPRELMARIRALRRRVEGRTLAKPDSPSRPVKSGNACCHGPWSLDPERMLLRFDETPIPLTLREFRLFETLLSRPGRVWSRDQLLSAAWPDDGAVIDRTVDAHVKLLRKKLQTTPGAADWIETVRGSGYRFRDL